MGSVAQCILSLVASRERLVSNATALLRIVELTCVTILLGAGLWDDNYGALLLLVVVAESIVVLSTMEALDRRLEAVKPAAQSQLSNSSQDSDVLGVSIAALELLLRRGERLGTWELEAVLVAVATELSVEIVEAVVTVVFDRVGLVWSIDENGWREFNLNLTRVVVNDTLGIITVQVDITELDFSQADSVCNLKLTPHWS